MKKLLVLSGKGGTGKTTVAGAIIEMSRCRAFADCDVDAPNLHLIASRLPEPIKTDYYGLGKAMIDESKCIHCGLCEQNCRFGAIENEKVGVYECEGCGVCAALCPVQAVAMCDHSSGSLMLYKDSAKVFSTAQLKMGSGASGKLVTAVKQQLFNDASDMQLAVIDGSPGIGCPVIASISGVDLVLIVAEPTVSGMHDMKRIIGTAKHFGVGCAVCINRFDINQSNTDQIESFCANQGISVIGKIPHDETVIKAVNRCQSIACYPDSPAGKALLSIWEGIRNSLLREDVV